MTIHIESETDTERIERCDHEGATEPLAGLSTVSVCSACGEIWPTRFGKGRGDCSDCLETRRSLLTKRESSIATGRMCRSRSYRSEPSTSIAPSRCPLPEVKPACPQPPYAAVPRSLEFEILGMTDSMAHEILGWYRKGELWLDEHGRLHWGPSITSIGDAGAEPGAAGATVSLTPRRVRNARRNSGHPRATADTSRRLSRRAR
jgi:hypothetical protein